MCRANLEAPVGRNRDSSKKLLATLNYLEIKQIMDRRSTQQKQGKLTDVEIKGLVIDWHDQRREGDLNKAVVDREMKTMKAKLKKYNVDQLGEIPVEREDGTMRITVCQMVGCAGKEVREINMSTTEKLIQKYDVNLVVCMELNFNWSKVNSSANLASWLHQEERETRSITAHNTQEQDAVSSRHQPGGMGMICRSEFIQYARKASVDPRGLGHWCSWQFFCNPNHASRIVVAYRTSRSTAKGLRTIYQQQLRFIQVHGINYFPVELLDRDLAKQIKEWRKSRERIVLVMDINDHPLTSKFYQQLRKEQTGLEELTHKCWDLPPLHAHIRIVSN